jgi:hypothetical protein
MRIRTLRLLAACLGLALCALAAPAFAQLFSAETRISTIQGPSYTPHIAAHSTNLHMTWWEDSLATGGVGEIYYARSTSNGTSWSAPLNISNNAGRIDALPQIGAGPLSGGGGSAAYIIWTTDPSGFAGDIYLRRSLDGGASWQAEQIISPAAGYSRPGSVLVDTSGRVHVAWYDSRNTGVGQVFYSLSCDNGANWSTAQFVTQRASNVDNEAPKLVDDSNGNIYMVVRSTTDGFPIGGQPPFSQYLIRAASGSITCGIGAGWVLPAQRVSEGLPYNIGNTYGAKAAKGAAGQIHVAYWQETAGNNVVFRSGNPRGAGFGPYVAMSAFGLDNPEWDGLYAEASGIGLADDLAGTLYAVAPQYASTQGAFQVGTLKFFKSTNGGGTWLSFDATTAPYASLPDGVFAGGKFHMAWTDMRDQIIGGQNNVGPEIYYRNVTAVNSVAPLLSFSPSTLTFPTKLVGGIADPQTVTVTNIGTNTATLSSVGISGAGFSRSGTCAASTSLPTGATCTIVVGFSPTAGGPASGTVTVASNGTGSPQTVTLSGAGTTDLIEHFYTSILQRPSDPGGKAFWSGEVTRMQSLTVNPSEVYFVLGGAFFNSGEYLAFNRNDTQYVQDLYNTFFDRSADPAGLAFWTGQLAFGMTRSLALYNFLFSAEFTSFVTGIIGNTPSRAEVSLVVDYYRGILGRLADTSGFNFWLARFRTAQCAGSTAIVAEVNNISQLFLASAEYANREAARPPLQRTDEYVGDLYYAFLRRGGDLLGFRNWANVLNTGAFTREQVRQAFVDSAEFQVRVTAVINQGCLP